MKTTKITLSMSVLMIATSLFFTSCRKKDKTEPEPADTEQSSAADNALAESTVNDIGSMGSQASENSTLTTYKTIEDNNSLAACAIIAHNGTTLTPATQYTLDFGNGTVCKDGRTRSGKLFIDLSGSTNNAKYYRNPGFKMVITSSSYVVDGNQVNIINKTVTNTTPLSVANQTAYSGTNLTWSVSANVSIVKANNGGTINWQCNRTKELINSNDPACYSGQGSAINWSKAKVQINGSASGTNTKSESYTATATNLVRNFNCTPDPNRPGRHPFISGTVDYKPGNRANRHIDYGNGSCDFNATVTVNGQTFVMTLP